MRHIKLASITLFLAFAATGCAGIDANSDACIQVDEASEAMNRDISVAAEMGITDPVALRQIANSLDGHSKEIRSVARVADDPTLIAAIERLADATTGYSEAADEYITTPDDFGVIDRAGVEMSLAANAVVSACGFTE